MAHYIGDNVKSFSLVGCGLRAWFVSWQRCFYHDCSRVCVFDLQLWFVVWCITVAITDNEKRDFDFG